MYTKLEGACEDHTTIIKTKEPLNAPAATSKDRIAQTKLTWNGELPGLERAKVVEYWPFSYDYTMEEHVQLHVFF